MAEDLDNTTPSAAASGEPSGAQSSAPSSAQRGSAKEVQQFVKDVEEKIPNMAPGERGLIAQEVQRELLESQEDRDADALAALIPLGAILGVEPKILKLAEHTKDKVKKERRMQQNLDVTGGKEKATTMNMILDDDDFEDIIMVEGVAKAVDKFKGGAKAKAVGRKKSISGAPQSDSSAQPLHASSRRRTKKAAPATAESSPSNEADSSAKIAAAAESPDPELEDLMRQAMNAAKTGEVDVLKALLERGVGINSIDSNGLTLAYAAAFIGNSEMVEYLSTAKADLEQVCLAGFTPTFVAAFRGHSDVLTILVSLGVNMNQADARRWTPTFAAAQQGHSKAVQILAAAGADVNMTTTKGFSPIFTAAFHGHDETVRTLTQLRADCNRTTLDCGFTPVFAAVQEGYPNAVKALLEAAADPNIPEQSKRWTPALLAARSGKADMLEMLCEAKADANRTDINGRNAIAEAVRHPECVDILKRYGFAESPSNGKRPSRSSIASSMKSGFKKVWRWSRSSQSAPRPSKAAEEKQRFTQSFTDAKNDAV